MRRSRHCGFTLIELMVVMAVIGLLATLVVPRYFQSVERAKEAVLKTNLAETRGALDKFFADNGRYPDDLKQLVDRKYLRSLPVDPVTNRNDTWRIVRPNDTDLGAVFDVASGASGNAIDGSAYASW